MVHEADNVRRNRIFPRFRCNTEIPAYMLYPLAVTVGIMVICHDFSSVRHQSILPARQAGRGAATTTRPPEQDRVGDNEKSHILFTGVENIGN